MNAHLDMTLRDWFAGQIAAAMVTRADLYLDDRTVKAITHDCYVVADAMMAEREDSHAP